MLCEVGYFFCGRTDSYFEENAKDGTISGRNHLRKELVMKVESSSYEAYLAAMDEYNLASLATAMNEGAANMGLQTIEDLDSPVSTLHEKLSTNWSSYFEVEEA